MSGTVLVTGGTGYIAGELIKQLLDKDWVIHTTVRNVGKSEAGLRQRFGNIGEDRLKVFQADLMNDDGWAEANSGCSHVAHVASPLSTRAPKHEDDMIVPAREGTLRALRFANASGAKRFVQTSSVAAVAYGRDEKKYCVNESDWTNVDHPDTYPYVKSKTIAERAAREWMNENGAEMEFVSVNPSLVLGPVDSADFSASVVVIKQLLGGSMPMAPDLGFGVVDTRDIADLHVRCLVEPGLDGERFIGSGRFMTMIEVGAVLRAALGDQASKVPTKVMPNWLASFFSLFNAEVRSIKGELGKVRDIDASHAMDRLGWKTRPEEESIVDCAKSLIEHGVVKV